MRWSNPYASLKDGKWLKCNFHVHDATYDGEVRYPRAEIAKMYKDADYDVITFSSQTECVASDAVAAEAGLAGVNGEEYARVDGFLLLGIQRFIDGTPQEAIDACAAQGGFSVACHPHMNETFCAAMPGRFTSPQLIRETEGFVGVEILNGALGRKHLPEMTFGAATMPPTTLGRTLATDTWDELLCAGRRVWGFGSDDSHVPCEINLAWTMLYAPSTAFADIKRAATDGRLYASTGLALKACELEGDTLVFRANQPHLEDAEIQYRVVCDGRVVCEERCDTLRFPLPQGARYVRVEAAADDGSRLWASPLFAE